MDTRETSPSIADGSTSHAPRTLLHSVSSADSDTDVDGAKRLASTEGASWGQADRMRPVVNSFDVFDTLIARRCLEPTRIHDIVEKKVGYPGFANIRCSTERALYSGEYTLDDIYRRMGEVHGIEQDILEVMKRAEIETELENAVPIADMITKVRDGDVLVSDMYLSDAIVRMLLAKAGFEKNIGIYVSSHGKSTRAIWPKLLSSLRIARHWGDNLESDVQGPKALGILTQHVGISSPLQAEAWLMSIGLRDLALMCREVRLRTSSTDPSVRQLVDIQSSLNFPMLLLASVSLTHLVQEKGFKRVLFSSRDGELWMRLFRVFARQVGLDCEVEYFYTSRMVRRFPSPQYLRYTRERLGERALVLDLCGTGWSLAHLVRSAGLGASSVFLLARYPKMEVYEKSAPTPAGCAYYSIIPPDKPPLGNANIELANQVPYGTVIDIKLIDSTLVPVFDADQRCERSLTLVRKQNEVFGELVNALERHSVRGFMAIDDASVAQVVEALAREISNQAILQTVFIAEHREEDMAVYSQLLGGKGS